MNVCWIALLVCALGGGAERVAGQLDQALVLRIQELIGGTRREDGSVDLSLLLRRYLSAPFPVPDFNISDSGAFSSLEGSFRNVTLSGLSEVDVRQIRLNLAHTYLTGRALFPLLRLEGEYDLKGSVTFFTVFGGGGMWMNASEVEMTASVFLRRHPAAGHLRVESVEVGARANRTQLHFERLGGALISGVTNALLNQLSSLLFRHVERSLLADLKEGLKEELDRHLARVPGDAVRPRTANLFDDVLLQAAESFKSIGLDPLPLEARTFLLRSRLPVTGGSVRLSDGTLSGLSTLRRTGDVVLVYDETGVAAEANVGFGNLTGAYGWRVEILGLTLSGRSSLSVRSVSAGLVLRQNRSAGSRPTVDRLKIDRIGQMWVEVEGLGTWDSVAEILVNLVANWLKLTLADAVSDKIKDAVQEQLDRLSVSLV
ncbi:uncharacterized protein [Centruroides vittatus]|uniref:uncharacterized protein n=1 Tax=Centruroides vittatus TaxID=120091 RepID=UPI00350F026D